jgi:hypothetical protein
MENKIDLGGRVGSRYVVICQSTSSLYTYLRTYYRVVPIHFLKTNVRRLHSYYCTFIAYVYCTVYIEELCQVIQSRCVATCVNRKWKFFANSVFERCSIATGLVLYKTRPPERRDIEHVVVAGIIIARNASKEAEKWVGGGEERSVRSDQFLQLLNVYGAIIL